MPPRSRTAAARLRSLLVLLVDSKRLWRETLAHAIRSLDGDIETREAESVSEAIGVVEADPDIGLVMLSVDPQGEDPLAGLDRLREDVPSLPVVVVADADEPSTIMRALSRGARGYVPATIDGAVLIGALRLVASGGTFIPESVLHHLTSDAGPCRPAAPAPRDQEHLLAACTPRQRQVLDLLCEGDSNKAIARRLDISEHTVKAHVRQIMKRLGVTNRTEAVLRATGPAKINENNAAS